MSIQLNGSYTRDEIASSIPGIHPQAAVSFARDELGGVVLMLLAKNSGFYANRFYAKDRELEMEIDTDDSKANDALVSGNPIRLFFKPRDGAYRYLGLAKFSRAHPSGLAYFFRLLEPGAVVPG
jgi:hypothetical protein